MLKVATTQHNYAIVMNVVELWSSSGILQADGGTISLKVFFN